MKKTAYPILLTTILCAHMLNAEEIDCLALSSSIATEVSADKSQVLEIVSSQVAAAPGCACEIVKSVIKASEADATTVAAIVEAAISEAPDHVRLISQCAIAAAPDAIGAVQALLAKIDPNSGDSGVGSKSAKAAAMSDDEAAAVDWNPLDFPGDRDSAIPGLTKAFGPQFENAPPAIITRFITDPNP